MTCANSRSSQAQAVESSEPTCLDGRPSDTSSGTTTASACSQPASLTDSSPAPRSLETCVSSHSPVRLSNTEDLRTWLAQGFPASRSLSQESSAEPMTIGTCGPQQRMSFAWFDQSTSSWKMCQASLLPDTQEPSSETWPPWGMWDAGAAYQQPTPELGIAGSDGGLWPTPDVPNGGRTMRPEDALAKGSTSRGKRQVGLENAVRYWPTPNVAMVKGSSHKALTRISGKSRANDRLDYAIEKDGKSGRLNPEWVAWLMGWPIGWEGLKPLATDKFREWLQQHGDY